MQNRNSRTLYKKPHLSAIVNLSIRSFQVLKFSILSMRDLASVYLPANA